MADFGGDYQRTRIVKNGRIFKYSRNGHLGVFFNRQSTVKYSKMAHFGGELKCFKT